MQARSEARCICIDNVLHDIMAPLWQAFACLPLLVLVSHGVLNTPPTEQSLGKTYAEPKDGWLGNDELASVYS